MREARKKSSRSDPVNGTPNTSWRDDQIDDAVDHPDQKGGTILPIRISWTRSGETISWSNVPSSRSRATIAR